MAKRRFNTQEEFLTKAKKVHGSLYDYSKVKYKASKVKVTIVCKKHGIFLQEPRIHLSGKGCLKCGAERRVASVTKTDEEKQVTREQNRKQRILQAQAKREALWEETISKLKLIHKDKLSFKRQKKQYEGTLCVSQALSLLQVRCNTHQTVFSAGRSLLLRGKNPCPQCKNDSIQLARKNKKIETQLRQKITLIKKKREAKFRRQKRSKDLQSQKTKMARRLGAKKFSSIDFSKFKYRGKEVKSIASCPEHGDFTTCYGSMLRSRILCPECKKHELRKRLTNSTAHFIKVSKERHGNKYDYSKSKYSRGNNPIIVICRKHGEFEVIAKDHMHVRTNYGECPACRVKKTGSQIEEKVYSWVKSIATCAVNQNDRQALKPNEVDIYLPELKVGIEVNGVYWHSDKFRPRKYHQNKAILAKSTGVTLLQFWEHELWSKTAIVKSMIRARLNQTRRIYARKTALRKLTSKERRAFFERNHLQSDAKAKIAYGLYESDTLVACMSFAKPRFASKYEYEIVRYANLLNTTVVGGASKLWTHFLRENNPHSVISYADLRFSQGGVYESLGFQFSHVTPPGYFWLGKMATIVSRYMTQKHKLKSLLKEKYDPSKTEVENLEAAGSNRVFDAGNLVYVWTRG